MLETVIFYGMRSVEKESRLSWEFTKQNNRVSRTTIIRSKIDGC